MFWQLLKEGKIIHQKGLRTLYTIIFPSEATETLICVVLFILSPKDVIFLV